MIKLEAKNRLEIPPPNKRWSAKKQWLFIELLLMSHGIAFAAGRWCAPTPVVQSKYDPAIIEAVKKLQKDKLDGL